MIVIPRLKSIYIKNYRSISEVKIDFPKDKPVILIGENNSGKSNILRAIYLLFGDYDLAGVKLNREDFNEALYRNTNRHNNSQINITITAEVEDFTIEGNKNIEKIEFTYYNERRKECFAFLDNGEKCEIENDEIQRIFTIFVNNEESLNYHLSYSSKNTLLSKFTKAFHYKLKKDQDKIQKLKELYTKSIKIMKDLREYQNFEKEFKKLGEDILFSSMKGFLELDFSRYDPGNYNYYKNLDIIFRDNPEDTNSKPRSLTLLGSGQKKMLMFLLAYCYAKNFMIKENLVLLIDEPELNLHPVAQKWFAKKLYEMSEGGLQIVVATHSPYFINIDYLESIYLVKKNDNGTYIVKNDANSLSEHCRNRGAYRSDPTNVIQFYSKSSTPNILQGFFARLVILVEGPTEELALPIYFQKAGLDLLKEGIEIISVSGKTDIPKWGRLFSAYKITCYVFFDYDFSENDKKKYEKQAKDILYSLGYNEQSIQNIIQELNSISGNLKENPVRITIKDSFCVFHNDFEEAMKEAFRDNNLYVRKEKKVGKEYSLSNEQKPLVAREVARQIVDEIGDNHPIIQKFKEISEKLRKLINGG